MVESKKLMVSVVMITYMHEAFIAEAINGVLMQRCDFDIELIIADDVSPDKTQEVVKSFQNHINYNWIKYIRHTENKGMMRNFIWALEQTNGKYIAFCEGDDYWTDPYKLQRQVDFLETNDGYSSIFHNVEQRWETIEQASLYLRDKTYQFGFQVKIDQLIGENIVPTCSLVFRKESFYKSINIIPWNQLDYGDWPIVMILATNGSVYYQPMISAVRRMNPTSAWGLQEHKKNILKTFRTRDIIKKTGLIEEKYIDKMKEYEFQLFLQLYNIKESYFFRLAKKSLGKIKRVLDKYSLQHQILINTKKFKRAISNK
jgi:glycosyltransferase involved in cell wall biosynthesis